MIWFCDASALVKRYVEEEGSLWFRHEVGRHKIVIAHITVVEVQAALAANYRSGAIALFAFYRARNKFVNQRGQYQILPLTESTVSIAASLVSHHPLRAYDAVQLATAVDYLKTHPSKRADLVFLTADAQLEKAARAEKLKTDNPNRHSRQ